MIKSLSLLPSSLAQLRAHYKTMRSWRRYLHICVSLAILKDTDSIINFPDLHTAALINRNMSAAIPTLIQKYPMTKNSFLSNELTKSELGTMCRIWD